MEWISVKDRLPELNVEVLAYNGKQMFVAIRWKQESIKGMCKYTEYFKSVICSCCQLDEGFDDEITHWMPIEPPKEQEERRWNGFVV